METALSEDFRADALASVRIDPGTLLDDLNGTPEYRAHLVLVMARRAMENLGSAQSYK
jgi:carbon-monoxide dehydrogenase medium subunit